MRKKGDGKMKNKDLCNNWKWCDGYNEGVQDGDSKFIERLMPGWVFNYKRWNVT